MRLWTRTCMTAVAFGGLFLAAHAQTADAPLPTCGARADLVEQLASQFHEMQSAIGQLHETAILEVFASDQGTWTIIASGTDGQSCVLAAGEDWESLDGSAGAGVVVGQSSGAAGGSLAVSDGRRVQRTTSP